MELEFVDELPPLRQGPRAGLRKDFVEALRAALPHGRWALYSAVRSGGISRFDANFMGIEWTTRRNEDGKTCTVYARVIPEGEELPPGRTWIYPQGKRTSRAK